MSGANKGIFCTQDRVRADGIKDSNGTVTVKCPVCGKTDTLSNATKDAAGGMASDMLGSVFKGSKSVSVKRSGAGSRWYLSDI